MLCFLSRDRTLKSLGLVVHPSTSAAGKALGKGSGRLQDCQTKISLCALPWEREDQRDRAQAGPRAGLFSITSALEQLVLIQKSLCPSALPQGFALPAARLPVGSFCT